MLEKVIMSKVTSEIKELGIQQYKAEDVINLLKRFYTAFKLKDYDKAKKLWGQINYMITEELDKRNKK